MEKLRAGLTIEMRGSHDHLLPEFVAELNKLGHLPQTLTLCTDDVFPDDLYQHGGLDDVVRRLVRYGSKPQWALQAATSTPPGAFNATISASSRQDGAPISVVFDDLKDLRARWVFANGQVVARDGHVLDAARRMDAGALAASVKIEPLRADDFRVRAQGVRARIATSTDRALRDGARLRPP